MCISLGLSTGFAPYSLQYEVNINFRLPVIILDKGSYFIPPLSTTKIISMRWENASSTSNNDIYHLWQNDKKVLTLTLHPFSNTARVECAGEKRVFLIRKEG